MSFEDFKRSLLDQWQIIAGAPAIFIMAILLVAVGIWIALGWAYSSRLQNKEALIDLLKAQLSDYKDKLSGATPDQAKARIDGLQEQLNKLALDVTPRSLSETQVSAISIAAARIGVLRVDVVHDMACPDGKRFAGQLGRAFQNADWNVNYPMVAGPGNPPQTGLGLLVRDLGNLNAAESTIAAALRGAGLQFDIQKGRPNVRFPTGLPSHLQAPDIELLVSSRLT